jgi:phosphotransferase system HPr (HPr) family protein
MSARDSVVIVDEVGLHARPAAAFVKLAGRFDADITVRCGERSANAKSILSVLTLEAGKGSEIELEAEGEDAQQAVDALVDLLRNGAG